MPANKGVEILPNQKVPLTNQLELKKSLKKIQQEYGFKLLYLKRHFNGKRLHSSLLSKK